MRFRPVIFISPSKFLICICFVILLGYVVLKHAVERKPKIPAVATFIVDSKTGGDGHSVEFFHRQFIVMSDCRAILGMSMERKSERVDTFKATGTIIKVGLLALYKDSSTSRLLDINISCVESIKDCRVDIYLKRIKPANSTPGCSNLEKQCLCEITCLKKTFWGTKTEKMDYLFLSDGGIKKFD